MRADHFQIKKGRENGPQKCAPLISYDVRELHIPPPHGVPEPAGLPFEAHRVPFHGRGLVDEQFQAVTSLEHPVNVVQHNAADLRQEERRGEESRTVKSE